MPGKAIVAILIILSCFVCPARADETGEDTLFIGHSFFVPVAEAFDETVARGSFPNHRFREVFRGGENGSAQALWENETARQEANKILATGEITLLGLTVHPSQTHTIEFFGRWVNTALKYNPKTRIFVGVPWVPLGPLMSPTEFKVANEAGNALALSLVARLRLKFPQVDIIYISYGSVMDILSQRYADGDLQDIDSLVLDQTGCEEDSAVCPGLAKSLFSDNFGHASPIGLHISSLVWAYYLYGADISALTDPAYSWSEVMSVASETILKNEEIAFSLQMVLPRRRRK